MTDHETKEDSKFRHKGSDTTAPYPVSRMAPAVELIDLAKEIANADQMLSLQVNNKLSLIADQIKTLQETARTILETAQRDQMLNQAECNFKKLPGKIYHLYKKPNSRQYLSLLAPHDWQGGSPHQFIGSFRFEADYSWTEFDQLTAKSSENSLVNSLIKAISSKD